MSAPVLEPNLRRAMRPIAFLAAAMIAFAPPVLAKGDIPAEQAERVAKATEKDAKTAAKVAEKTTKVPDDSSPDEPPRTTVAAPNVTGPAARPALNARSGGAASAIPPVVKFGLLGLFLLLLGVIGWLLWSNMRLKRQLNNARQSHSDPARTASRRTLVSETDGTRQRPPYQGEGQVAQDTGYTPRGDAPPYGQGAPEPRILGDDQDDQWAPDLPTGKTGGQEPHMPRLTPQSGGSIAQNSGFAAPPAVTPEPAPAFTAPSGPTLRLPLANVQDLVRRAPEMAASEFRAAANALGQWREVNVNGTGGTLHLGEEDGLPRPLIAILQDDGNAVVLPSAQYARDFAFQHYKIRNNESLRPFFDLELSSRTELAYAAPCIVAVEGQVVRVLQRGVLSGFSD